MQLDIRQLTPDLWPALVDLFGARGASNGCWCMYCRIGAAYHKRQRAANKADFHKLVEAGPPPGLLAFAEDEPVGWCQITPRDAVPWLDRVWRLRRVDDLPVWSLTCLYIRIGHRRSGIATRLIEAAIDAARAAGHSRPTRSTANSLPAPPAPATPRPTPGLGSRRSQGALPSGRSCGMRWGRFRWKFWPAD